MESLNIILGKPSAGWLPVDISATGFDLSFEASDLGLNVIDQLVDVAVKLGNKQAVECYFYLEPEAYTLKFRPASNTIDFQIEFTEDFDLKDDPISKIIFYSKINCSEFRKSLIGSLRMFQDINYSEKDWPSPKKTTLLKQLINSKPL